MSNADILSTSKELNLFLVKLSEQVKSLSNRKEDLLLVQTYSNQESIYCLTYTVGTKRVVSINIVNNDRYIPTSKSTAFLQSKNGSLDVFGQQDSLKIRRSLVSDFENKGLNISIKN